MTRELWRIATDTPDYEAHDISGKGAELTGGRWNSKGSPVVYTAGTRALACLETVVHLNADDLPLNRYLVEIRVPDTVWNAREEHAHAALPVGWDTRPTGVASIRFGEDWLKAKRSALLVIPSVIVEEELNILINPLHSDSAAITSRKVRQWDYDARLRAPKPA